MVNINGIAHIQLSVRDMTRSLPFYKRLLNFLSMQTIVESDDYFYCVGGRTGLAISQAAPEFRDEAFEQLRIGLHHVCFRARSREDVDAIHEVAVELGAPIVHPPEEGGFAPGYYSVLFEDPDGIRIEANFVPGKGHLEDGRELPLKARGVF
jgi:catechol 2,3-dioxygenase-like lactoylglutathione lyase family enzyme